MLVILQRSYAELGLLVDGFLRSGGSKDRVRISFQRRKAQPEASAQGCMASVRQDRDREAADLFQTEGERQKWKKVRSRPRRNEGEMGR